jgi:Rrf2 family nitric oxide-sensitive transcriptional repressor
MKVVHALGQKGYIDTTRGKGGGLALSDLPNRINVGRVVRDMEADLGLVECLGSSNRCVISPECRLKQLLVEALGAFFEVLDRRTLADLTAEPEPLAQLLTLDYKA